MENCVSGHPSLTLHSYISSIPSQSDDRPSLTLHSYISSIPSQSDDHLSLKCAFVKLFLCTVI